MMNFIIKNPQEDQYGNQKENIFLAFDEKNQYLGHAYLFLTLNHTQIQEIPLLIYFDIVLTNEDKTLRKYLFDTLMKRASVLRAQHPNLKARVYTGFESCNEKLAFYLENGLSESNFLIMEKDLSGYITNDLNFDLSVQNLNIHSKDLSHYEHRYNELFLTPLDTDLLIEQSKSSHFQIFEFYKDEILVGGCTVFEKASYGYLDSLYITPHQRGKGYANKVMNYVFCYFVAAKLNKSQLEVWDCNRVAVNLYQSLGYHVSNKSMMLPGIDL